MIIKDVAIDKEVKAKVYTKHNVRFNEIKLFKRRQRK